MMHLQNVLVDLPKDRRPEVYGFRLPRGEAKGCSGAFDLLRKSKLRSRKNAHRRCGILRRSKPSSTSVEVHCPKLVSDLGRPRFDVVETVEPISKSSEEDNEASELYEPEEVLGVVFPTDQDAALPLNPGKEALHEPPSHIAA